LALFSYYPAFCDELCRSSRITSTGPSGGSDDYDPVIDPGSENGTLVNGSEIASGARVPLRDGDRIHLGAWTLITIQSG
jgi:hypothetical protein